MRQPLEPVPRSGGIRREGGEDAQVLGRVEGGQPEQRRAGQRACRLRRPADRQDPEPAQGDGHGRALEPGATPRQVLRHCQQLGIVVGQRVAAELQAHGRCQRQRTAADPHLQEVLVGRGPLPDPLAAVHQRQERRQVGVQVLGRGPLDGPDPGELVGDVPEMSKVAATLASPRATGHVPRPEAQGEAGTAGEQQRGCQPEQQPAAPRGRRAEQQRKGAGTAEQRQQQDRRAVRSGGPGAWRRGDHDLAGRHRGRIGARWPVQPVPAGAGQPGGAMVGLGRAAVGLGHAAVPRGSEARPFEATAADRRRGGRQRNCGQPMGERPATAGSPSGSRRLRAGSPGARTARPLER